MNVNVLKGKIVERGFTVESFCAAAGFNRSTFDRKVSGKNEFDLGEVRRIVQILHLNHEEMRSIFFADDVT